MNSPLPEKHEEHSVRAATFGALCAISAFPFLAFIIIGLGRLMNDNYWLSSLIVGLICVAVGGPLAMTAIKKMKEEDFTLPLTRGTLEEDRQVMNSNVHRIRSRT
ncbi:MAG: phage holin family protein [Methylotenera sp.]|nr:phage holin family protein [Oligoflexia bacterium]